VNQRFSFPAEQIDAAVAAISTIEPELNLPHPLDHVHRLGLACIALAVREQLARPSLRLVKGGKHVARLASPKTINKPQGRGGAS